MDANVLNIKFVTVRCWLHVLSNTLATVEAQSMKKLSNTEAKLKKDLAYKKRVHKKKLSNELNAIY